MRALKKCSVEPAFWMQTGKFVNEEFYIPFWLLQGFRGQSIRKLIGTETFWIPEEIETLVLHAL